MDGSRIGAARCKLPLAAFSCIKATNLRVRPSLYATCGTYNGHGTPGSLNMPIAVGQLLTVSTPIETRNGAGLLWQSWGGRAAVAELGWQSWRGKARVAELGWQNWGGRGLVTAALAELGWQSSGGRVGAARLGWQSWID